MPLDRSARRLLGMLAATGGAASGVSLEARRAALATLAQMADDASTPVAIEHRTIPGPAGPLEGP